jgi:DNA invertase Pin-like site-specific DNA recombinase
MTRALIAARKSTKVDGREGHSLHTQDEHARAFCERLGWEVAGVARDTISGRVAPLDRKGLGAWLAEPTRFDVVVAYRTDRLSRGDQEDWTRIEHWATERKKTLVIVDGGTGIRYPARDDSDYWQWQATKREAGREWESARERNLRSQAALVKSGAVTGSSPFGYRIAGEKYAKTFEPVPHEARLVREAFARVTDGAPLSAVARWLTEVSGRSFGVTGVHVLVNNWTYAGRIERNGLHYADCPPIITADELVAAQQAMRSRAKHPGGRPALGDPPLMVLGCGECGGRMYRAGNAARGAHGYYCRGNHGFGVPAAAADAAVMKILMSSDEPEMVKEVVPGRDYLGDIEGLKRDRRQALERDDIEAVLRLTDALKDLEGRETEPDSVELRATGRTVGEAYRAMSRDEVRAELKEWTITAFPNGRLVVKSPWRPA